MQHKVTYIKLRWDGLNKVFCTASEVLRDEPYGFSYKAVKTHSSSKYSYVYVYDDGRRVEFDMTSLSDEEVDPVLYECLEHGMDYDEAFDFLRLTFG